MIYGNPTWSILYRGLIEGLRAQYRCVALDLAGFGLSAPPSAFSFKPEDQARLVAGFLDRLDLKDATLIGHDWGGPVGLGAAMMTGRISRLCLGNSWAWPVNGDCHFEWFSKLMGGPVGRFGSERHLTFVNLLMPPGVRRRKLSAEELDLYRTPFREVQSRRGMHVFPLGDHREPRVSLAPRRLRGDFPRSRVLRLAGERHRLSRQGACPVDRAHAAGRGPAALQVRPLPLD